MKEKNYGIEILRIVAMLMIVSLHVIGTVLPNVGKGIDYYVLWLLEIMSYCAVNCFGMITGYVMCGRKTHYERILSIWFIAFFYSVLFAGIFVLLGKGDRFDFIRSAFPIMAYSQWYLVSYFALFMFIPFLNVLLKNLDKQKHILLLCSCFFLFCILESMSKMTVLQEPKELFMLNNGYSPLWLGVLFCFGAYIKKYGEFRGGV